MNKYALSGVKLSCQICIDGDEQVCTSPGDSSIVMLSVTRTVTKSIRASKLQAVGEMTLYC